MNEVDDELLNLRAENKKLKSQIIKLEEQLVMKHTKVSKLKEQVVTIQSQYEELLARVVELTATKAKKGNLEKDITDLKKQLGEEKQQTQRYKREIEEKDQSLQKAVKALAKLRNESQELIGKINLDKDTKLKELQDHIDDEIETNHQWQLYFENIFDLVLPGNPNRKPAYLMSTLARMKVKLENKIAQAHTSPLNSPKESPKQIQTKYPVKNESIEEIITEETSGIPESPVESTVQYLSEHSPTSHNSESMQDDTSIGSIMKQHEQLWKYEIEEN